MARNYRRDKSGRFAGGGGGGGKAKPKATGGTLAARSSLKRSQGKAAANASPQQRGAVTKASNKLQAAKQQNQRRVRPTARPGAIKGRVPRKPAVPAAPARRPIANNIRPLNRQAMRRGPAALKASAVRSYVPATPRGQDRKIGRRLSRAATAISGSMKEARGLSGRASEMKTKLARQSARDIAGRLKGGVDGMISGTMQQAQGRRLNAAANNVIRARAARATAAAARGSKPAARAREIYGAQLASMGGKGRKVGKNNIQPGPRNTKGKPKKKRTRKPKA